MNDPAALALAATRRLRDGAAARGLPAAEQRALASDLDRIERVLRGEPRSGADRARPPVAAARYGDPYAIAQATPADLQRELAGPGGAMAPRNGGAGGATSATGATGATGAAPGGNAANPPRQGAIRQFTDAGAALDAVDFPGFVTGLINGTFQAIVDATAHQMREYAQLVASLSRTADEFARDNVSDDQVRATLAAKHRELRHVAAPPGQPGPTRLELNEEAQGSSPTWLADYDLADEELSPELLDGPLLDAGRRQVAEERMRSLATMVLMGVNRVVVSAGDIRAKLQFTASAADRSSAEMATAQVSSGIAGRSGATLPQLSVSTVKGNTQSDASIKANLTGEVRITFRTETFPLERFADSAAIQLLDRHARWRREEAPAPGAAAGPAGPAGPASPATASTPPEGEGRR
ncbi:MAG: hypothetical protein IPI49_08120 [Myxococcales bacterium]|nr:hypothetical protein [Myxococcales bacterium]